MENVEGRVVLDILRHVLTACNLASFSLVDCCQSLLGRRLEVLPPSATAHLAKDTSTGGLIRLASMAACVQAGQASVAFAGRRQAARGSHAQRSWSCGAGIASAVVAPFGSNAAHWLKPHQPCRLDETFWSLPSPLLPPQHHTTCTWLCQL